MTKTKTKTKSKTKTKMGATGHTGSGDSARAAPVLTTRPLLVGRAQGQVLLMEANGDRQPDLFGEALLSPQSGSGGGGGEGGAERRHFWINELKTVGGTCLNGLKDDDEEETDCGGHCYPCRCFLASTAAAADGQGRRDTQGTREEGGVGVRGAGEEGEGGCGFVVVQAIKDRSGDGVAGELRSGGWGALSETRAHAFADINGDCLSDLLVASVHQGVAQYEVWINDGPDGKRPNFRPPTHNQVLLLPTGAGSVSVLDFNRDGSLDLVFAVSYGCAGTVLRSERQGNVGVDTDDRDARGSRRQGDEFELDGHAPCAISEIHLALNARSEVHRHASQLCERLPVSEESTFGIPSQPAAADSPRGRVGQVIVRSRDFLGASLFGAREPVPHISNTRGKAPLLASKLGMDARMLHVADIDLDGFPDLVSPLPPPHLLFRLASFSAASAGL